MQTPHQNFATTTHNALLIPNPDAAKLARWEASLNRTDRTIVEVASSLYAVLNAPGACYHTSFFLYYYLKHRYNIVGNIEVGFINDGTDQRYASHAWFTHSGRITDLAVSRPFDPTNNRVGPVTILGREIIPGWRWRYHRETSKEALQAIRNLFTCASDNPHDMISIAKMAHIRMSDTARSDQAIRALLDSAPKGMTYIDLVEKIEMHNFALAA